MKAKPLFVMIGLTVAMMTAVRTSSVQGILS
jgi:hypothetical protein